MKIMISFTGILKYSIYLFIAGWMFFLGIMVGRGNSPVTFDTQGFQDRLQTIATEFGHKKDAPKKIDLKFYDVLKKPAAEEGDLAKRKTLEIIPKKEPVHIAQTDARKIQTKTKTSLKKKTYKIKKEVNKTKQIVKSVSVTPPKKRVSKKTIKLKNTEPPKKILGRYTIQIAAYKEFKDAVTQMAILEKKGFSSYRQKTIKNGITWYRIRTGSFVTYDDAKKFKAKLDKAKINSMIIKKEDHENIKG